MINNFINRLKLIIKPGLIANSSSRICFLPDDMFLVSYPKSGNTWLRFMIGNYLTNNQCDFTNSHLIVPDIHFNPEQCNQLQSPRFIKSHMPFTSDYRKVVYLVRDGRDVAVSYYFYLMKMGRISKETKFEDYIEEFNQGSFDGFSSWSNHVNSWLENAPQKFLLVRYEDMKNNPLHSLTDILNFSGISVDIDAANAAIKASQFENMKKMEQVQHDLFEALAKSDKTISFVRKGEVGTWRNFFSKKLSEQFLEVHGSALKKLNYL